MKQTITVPTGYVKQLLRQVSEQGYDTAELLASLDIDPSEIEHQTEFSAKKFGRLYQRVMYITQDEYFGMLSGGKIPNGTFRMMCYAIIQCKSLGHAIHRASDFHEIVRGTQIKPQITRQGRYAKLTFAIIGSLDNQTPNIRIDSEPAHRICNSLSMWYHFMCWLVGERIALKGAYFSFDERATQVSCRHKFYSEVKFNQHGNAIIFPARYLDYPIVQNTKTLKGFLKTAPYQLIVIHDDDNSLTAQVAALIGRDFSLPPPSAQKVAETLNMSISTLRRRLIEEKTTFQKIKDSCRKASAIKYMNAPQLSLSDVADLMGFDEPSAFFRSFKRWMGMTPSEYRQSEAYLQQLSVD